MNDEGCLSSLVGIGIVIWLMAQVPWGRVADAIYAVFICAVILTVLIGGVMLIAHLVQARADDKRATANRALKVREEQAARTQQQLVGRRQMAAYTHWQDKDAARRTLRAATRRGLERRFRARIGYRHQADHTDAMPVISWKGIDQPGQVHIYRDLDATGLLSTPLDVQTRLKDHLIATRSAAKSGAYVDASAPRGRQLAYYIAFTTPLVETYPAIVQAGLLVTDKTRINFDYDFELATHQASFNLIGGFKGELIYTRHMPDALERLERQIQREERRQALEQRQAALNGDRDATSQDPAHTVNHALKEAMALATREQALNAAYDQATATILADDALSQESKELALEELRIRLQETDP